MKGPDLAKQAGITYRQLDNWCNQGYLGRNLKGNGTGNDRWFETRDRLRVHKIAGLVRCGLPVGEASDIVMGDAVKYQALYDALQHAKPT